nr:MAG: peptidase A6 family protein [Chemarfal virus 65]
MNNSNKNKNKTVVRPLTQQQEITRQLRNKRRNEKRRQKKLENRTLVMSSRFGAAPSVDNSIRKSIKRLPNMPISKEGMDFLKCAFAPPDFANTDVAGYPDDYNGLSLVKKHRVTYNSTALASNDTYIILAPVPGVAFYILNKAAGVAPTSTDFFSAVRYPDFSTLFPTVNTADNVVTDFRYISNHLEFIPMVNQMQWTGSIQAAKINLTMMVRPSQATAGAQASNILTVTGLNATANFGNAQQYTGPFINGLFAGCYSNDSSRDFCRIVETISSLPKVIDATNGDFGGLDNGGGNAFAGLDNSFESLMIKISNIGTNTLDAYMIKTWACVEYKAITGGALYEYQRRSPTDYNAIRLYKEIISQLPVGVSYIDNDTFWERVYNLIKRITSVGSVVPGPLGMASSGVGLINEAMKDLFL